MAHDQDAGSPPEARPKIVLSLPSDWTTWCLHDAVGAAADLDPIAADALIRRGSVWIGRYRQQDPGRPVAGGEQLTIHFAPPGTCPASVQAADLLYEDAALLVLNKLPGVYVTMTPWDATGDLLWAAREYLAARDGRAPILHLAHRLDRDTSGVLVLSKDPAANAPLQQIFLDRTVEKRYLALVDGSPPDDHFVLRTGHGRGAHGLFRVYPYQSVGTRLPYGRNAVKTMETDFAVAERFLEATLVEARPITGRTHQIRLHLAHAGYPVAGDRRYGGSMEVAGIVLSHHLLHAATLCLPHPIVGLPLRLEAPLPPLFAHVLGALQEREVKNVKRKT